MSYTLEKLLSTADCDSVLELAGKEKSDFDFRKISTQRHHDSFEDNNDGRMAELQKINASIAASEAIIASLPDGDRKEAEITEKMTLEARKRTLTAKQKTNGVSALLMKELELAVIDKQLVEVADFIAAVQTRKASL